MPRPIPLVFAVIVGIAVAWWLHCPDTVSWHVVGFAYLTVGIASGGLAAHRVPVRSKSAGLERAWRVEAGVVATAVVLPLPLVAGAATDLFTAVVSLLVLPIVWIPAAAGAWVGGRLRIAVADRMERTGREPEVDP